MLTLVLNPIEEYTHAHSTKEPKLLSELSKQTFYETGLVNMSIGHTEGAFLRLLVKISGAKRVLDIGTFAGYSALMMAEGLPEDGELITLDNDPKITEIAKYFFSLSPHGKKIKLILGDANETIKDLEGTFDVVFIDADKESYINYWELGIPKVKSGGLIVADNVLWSGRVLNPKSENDFALNAFNKHVLTDERVEVVMLTIRDGVTVAYKK
jgi:caffeoyl-CoA O-methyltransferase